MFLLIRGDPEDHRKQDHISIHLMFLLIFLFWTSSQKKENFNTSHVSINRASAVEESEG